MTSFTYTSKTIPLRITKQETTRTYSLKLKLNFPARVLSLSLTKLPILIYYAICTIATLF